MIVSPRCCHLQRLPRRFGGDLPDGAMVSSSSASIAQLSEGLGFPDEHLAALHRQLAKDRPRSLQQLRALSEGELPDHSPFSLLRQTILVHSFATVLQCQ